MCWWAYVFGCGRHQGGAYEYVHWWCLDRVWSLHRDYVQALLLPGYDELPRSKLRIAIKHNLTRIRPRALQARMKNVMQWREDENFHRDFSRSMLELASQAKCIQDEQVHIPGHQPWSRSRHVQHVRKEQRVVFSNPRVHRQHDKIRNNNASHRFKYLNKQARVRMKGRKRKREESDLLPCLNKQFSDQGGRYYLQECPNTNEETRKINSAIVVAVFGTPKVPSELLTNQSSYVNLIPEAILAHIRKVQRDLDIQHLYPPIVYKDV